MSPHPVKCSVYRYSPIFSSLSSVETVLGLFPSYRLLLNALHAALHQKDERAMPGSHQTKYRFLSVEKKVSVTAVFG
jgi:hypothetical protein